ncbi:SLC13 family permease [Methanopyrus sp.]
MSVWVDLNAVGFVAVQSAVTAEWIRTGAVHRVRRAMFGERPGTVRVTLMTGLLSMFLTNDAALITVLSLLAPGARRPHRVILPALISANSIGALTPLGNPQNAIVYSHYHVNPVDFFLTQLPVCAALLTPGLLYAWMRGERIESGSGPAPDVLDVAVVIAAAGCLLAHIPVYLWFPAVFGCYAVLRPHVVREVDWVVIGLLTVGVLVPSVIGSSGWHPQVDDPFVWSVLLSQVVSNVPATVLVAPLTDDWRDLLHGVTVGGYGTPVASVANLIALRAAGGRGLRDYAVLQGSCLVLGVLSHYALR